MKLATMSWGHRGHTARLHKGDGYRAQRDSKLPTLAPGAQHRS